MKITFTNTNSTTSISVGRFQIAAASTLQVDTSTCSSTDLASLQTALTMNQVSCVTDVLIPQGLGGTGQYVAGTAYTQAPATIASALSVSATQLQAAYSATPTFDLSQGTTVVLAPVTANITAITITNPPAAGTIVTFVIPTSGAYTITWPASFKKAADGTAAASKKGVGAFEFDGTNYVQVGGAIAFN